MEKVLKALLAWHDRPFRKTHNLEELGQACLALDPSLRELVDRAVPLTAYAWAFRYPGEPDDLTKQEAEDAVAVARDARAPKPDPAAAALAKAAGRRRVVAAVSSRLPPESA